MKKQICLFIAVLALVFMSHSVVSANDPPHNPDSDVDCGDCHGEALFSTDPGSMTPEQLKDAYNNMCKRCHTSAAGSYHGTAAPVVGAHNDTIVQGSFTFDTSCIDCHHPHYQSDQFWYGRKYYGSEYRLFTGQGSVTSTLTNPTRTVITYNPATLSPKSGSSWDTSGPPDNDVEVGLANLAAKTTSGRGAAFLPNTASPYNSHMIESIDTAAKTITVKGTVSSVATAGFAIAYGQVVKRDLPLATASGNTVILLDRTGQYSYAHSDGLGAGGKDSTVTGICQVCHTQTGHWRNTPDAARDNHFSGENCMNCHQHLTGFKPNFVDHYDLATPYVTDYTGGSEETCVSCHVSPGTYNVDRDYITYVHNFTCENCHVDFDSPPTLKVGPNGNGDAQLTDGSNTCSDCHGTTGGYNYSVDFENAHDVKDHDGLVGKTGTTIVSNCNYCHTGDIINLDATPDVHNDNCFNCHTNTGNDGQLHGGNTGSSYNGVVSVGTAAGHTVGTTSNCSECHATRASDFSSHDHSNATYHEVGGSVRTDSTVAQGAGDTSQNSAQLCSACHNTNGGGLTGWDDIYVEHNSDCNTCHNATRDTSASGANTIGATIQTVIGANGNPTNCSACHRDKSTTFAAAGSVHGDHKQEGWVRGAGTSCVGCHDQDNNDDHTQYITVIHKNNCALCHTNPGTGNYTLKAGSSAENHRVPEDGAENLCTTCHSLYNTDFDGGHQSEDHQSQANNDVVTGSSNCATTCHTIDVVNLDATPDVHNDDCALCHTNTGSDGRLTSGAKGDATGHTIDSTSECVDCHAAFATDFQGEHGGGFNHTGVVTYPNCTTTCHPNSVALTITATHTDCTVCHTNTGSNGTLISGTNGDGTGHVVGSTSSCADCHNAYNGNFWVAHDSWAHLTTSSADALVGNASCTTTCHDGSSANNIVLSPSTHNMNCGACHTHINSNGTLRSGTNGDASGHALDSTSSCQDCHDISQGGPGGDFDGGSHSDYDHSGMVGTSNGTPVANCNGCHDGTTGPNIVTNTHAACTNCHSNTGASGTLIIGANGYGTAAAHTLGSTSSCADCHNAHNTSFESHIHSDATNHKTGGSGTTITQGVGDVSQEAGTLCSVCHQDKNGGATTLTSWDEIAYEHDLDGTKDGVGSCVYCHNATRDVCSDGSKCTQSGTTIQDVIAVGGDPTNCAACHESKVDATSSNAAHGGHDDTHFAWTASCGTAACHDQASNPGVANDIHGDGTSATCTMCHNTAGGGTGTAKTGGAANGVDADARSGIGAAPHAAVECTTCHDIADADVNAASLGGIHHDNKTDGVVVEADCTSKCHNASGQEGDHTARISSPADSCATCHTNTAGGGAGTGAPIDPGDDKMHDKCTSCHGIAATPGADGFLLTKAAADTHEPDWVTAMPDGGAGTNNGGGLCTDCHGTYFNSHTHSHSFIADVSCATCHGNPTPVTSNASDAVATPFIGTGEVHATSTCATCHDLDATPTGALIDSAIGQSGATGCVDCHIGGGDTWISIHTADAVAGLIHIGGRVGSDPACASCHGNPTPGTSNASDAQTTPYTVAGDVHAGGCGLCHTGANDGALQPGPFTNADTIINGDCTACHADTSTWIAIHTGAGGMSHSTRVDALASCTISCHTATAGGPAGLMPVNSASSRAGDMVHDACSACHTAAGALNSGNTTYGNQPIAKGNCGTCHTAGYFDSHVHGTAAGYISHVVTYEADGLDGVPGTAADNDTSQSTPQGCADCHDDNSGTLASWADIYFEHTSSCTICHSYTDDGNGTPLEADVNASMGSRTTATCDTCHEPKTPDVDHGGHAADFGSDAACTTCHTVGTGVLINIHGDGTASTCTLCHSGSPTRDNEMLGAATNGIDGDARLANGTAAAGSWASKTCLTCHPADGNSGAFNTTAAAHHVSANNYVANGNCTQCHTDPRTVANNTDLPYAGMPLQLSCSRCHVDVTGSTVEIVSITPGVAGSTANGLQTGNVRTALSSHTFTITSGTGYGKIVNYGACLYCHGTTGQGAGRATTGPVPFHAQVTYANIGGEIADGQAEFRIGDVDTGDGGTGDSAFYGHGRGRFNLKHAEFSIHDHYLQGQVAWQNNYGGDTGTWSDINAPEAYAFVGIKSKNGDNLAGTYYVPVFDTSFISNTHCSGSCDTVTIDISKNGTEWNGRVLGIAASSNNTSAQMTVIHGGVATALSCSSGSCTGSLDYSGYPANVRWNASDDNYVWIVSDQGGWAKANPRGTPP